jgi:hypothetical protein
MMDETRLDDAALDVLVSRAVRVDAPEGFAVRVGAALDSRETSAHSRAWLRPALAIAAMLLLAALWWWRQPVPVNPEVSREARAVTPAPVAPGRTSSHPVAPGRTSSHPVSHGRTSSHPVTPVYVRVDHERALDALDAVVVVQQKAIDPTAIATRTIDVPPAAEIAPLNVDTDRPDPGGEGDHR